MHEYKLEPWNDGYFGWDLTLTVGNIGSWKCGANVRMLLCENPLT